MPNNDNEKYNWWNATRDYGHGWSHGFQSRGIAPSFLGSDSLPQGIADLHWALHGIQDNMDKLDGMMGTFNDNIAKIANDMKKDVIEHLEEKILNRDKNGVAPLTTDTCYISKIMTTRTRIFSDSFGPESAMPVSGRIRGLTKNYDWIQYTQKNPTCEGEYDKIIDFNFVSDHQENDRVDSRHVTKGKIILDKAGMVKRVFVTQRGSNIVLWYIVSQSIPSEIGVGYTGSIKRLEYDKDSNLVSDKWLPVNHTPLMLLGAFSGDSNNETEFSQYVSTDYKLYQHIDGVDKEIGHLPTELIMLIDPLNDVVSDSKQAYIMKYNDEGKLIMPMKAFTLIDMFSNGKLIDKFSIVAFDNQNKLFTSFVSISPRTETTLSRTFNKDNFVTIEGGYHVELYDNNTTYPNTPHSHIFLLSSTREIRDFDIMAPNMMNYHSDAPSEFSMKRERDYTEFNQITFKSGLNKMFPEIASDFGIPNDIPFTLETDWNDQKELITIWLKEPFILERDISNSDVNNRRGFTVVQNSDYVKDIADTDILSVYKQLDFTIKNPTTRNYLTTLPKYDETYQLPKYLRYRVVEHSDTERGEATTEVTYFDENSNIVATIDSPNKSIKGNIKYNENLTPLTNRSNKFSPSVKSNLLSDLVQSDVIYLEGKNNHLDKPYGSVQYTLENETTGAHTTQRLYCSDTSNNPIEEVVFTRTITSGKVGEWFGHGYISSLKYLNIPGTYNTNSEENGSFFRSSNTDHKVFQNIVSREITVDGISHNNTHVIYRVTNNIGLSMEYHNVVIREERESMIGYTSKPWRLMYDKWIPGEYVGNNEFPIGPDNDSVTQNMVNIINNLETKVNSLDSALRSIVASLIKSGAWDSNATPNTTISLNGALKSGIDLAYGNINLFGGALDGNSFIRTNNGQTENDLAGILDA